MDTRQKIRMFNLAFGRPVSSVFQHGLSQEDRILLGSILLEEVLEYVTKGLGLYVEIPNPDDVQSVEYGVDSITDPEYKMVLKVDGRRGIDWKEIIDGLADCDVVTNFAAHWHGFNLNYATHVVNESNMSKLDPATGQAIINGVTPGYEGHPDRPDLADAGFDPNKPIGKILKGSNFREPDFTAVLAFGNPPYDPWDNVSTTLSPVRQSVLDGTFGVRSATDEERAAVGIGPAPSLAHISESEAQPGCELDHCADHPDQTTKNCEGGYGLAGGGVGSYYVCGECGNVFGKTNESDED